MSSIVTKDKIFIENIPDGFPEEQLKAIVADVRAKGGAGKTFDFAELTAQEQPAQEPAPQQQAPQQPGQYDVPSGRPQEPQEGPGMLDVLAGPVEAVASLALGAAAPLTAAQGLGSGIVDAFMAKARDPNLSREQAAKIISDNITENVEQGIYVPRTETGQKILQWLGAAGEAVAGLGPVSMPLQAASRVAAVPVESAAAAAGEMGRMASSAASGAMAERGMQPRQRVEPVMPEEPGMGQPMPPRQPAGITAAQPEAQPERRKRLPFMRPKLSPQEQALKDMMERNAAERRRMAGSLDIPMRPTLGQETREFGQQQFEREIAKNPELGGPIRDRWAEQTMQIHQNFDSMIDKTGALTTNDLRGLGITVTDELKNQYNKEKARVRLLYDAADKAGELENEVRLDDLMDYLNEKSVEATEDEGKAIRLAGKKAVQLGLAGVDPETGMLVAMPGTLKRAEILRKTINEQDYEQRAIIRQATMIKGLIDDATEGAGGELYKKAREARRQQAQKFEDVRMVDALLSKKRGYSDKAVAYENVFNHIVMTSDLDSIKHLGILLKKGGPEGQKAWRELQGNTLAWIKQQAAGGVTTDSLGQTVISPAGFNRAVNKLDANGKLDYILGKNGAERVRLLRDVSQDFMTAPPGAVNTSGTASALAVIADLVISSNVGFPAPVALGAKEAIKRIKDRKLRLRVEQALNNPKKKPE